jgi:Ni,Fe-hydrogenase III large subunit
VDARLAKAGDEADGETSSVWSREDARRTAPYDGYRAITLDWSAHDDQPGGTAAVTASALRLVRRLKLSADIMRVCAETLGAAAPGQPNVVLKAGQGSAQIQTAHGPARIEVTLADDQTIAAVRLETRSAAAMAEARAVLPGQMLAHVPPLLAGLGLCPSCADL